MIHETNLDFYFESGFIEEYRFCWNKYILIINNHHLQALWLCSSNCGFDSTLKSSREDYSIIVITFVSLLLKLTRCKGWFLFLFFILVLEWKTGHDYLQA